MKQILILSALIASVFFCKAQSSVFCVQVNCPQTVAGPQDSILIFGLGTINTGAIITDSVVSYLWKQVSGPSLSVIASPTAPQTMVRKLTTGTYIFSLTATTKKGQVGIADNAVVTVLPTPVRNVVTGGTIKLVNGQLIFVPTYLDGKP